VAAALYPVLKRLCDVFSLHSLLEESNTLLESGYANGHQVQMLRDQVSHKTKGTRDIGGAFFVREGCGLVLERTLVSPPKSLPSPPLCLL
jgi:hypothetical protein